jgi:hypothetical protein
MGRRRSKVKVKSERSRQPGALPRLRGRGEQSDIVGHVAFRSALYRQIGPFTHGIAQFDEGPVTSRALLATASQARQRSTILAETRLPSCSRLAIACFAQLSPT